MHAAMVGRRGSSVWSVVICRVAELGRLEGTGGHELRMRLHVRLLQTVRLWAHIHIVDRSAGSRRAERTVVGQTHSGVVGTWAAMSFRGLESITGSVAIRTKRRQTFSSSAWSWS